MTEVISYLILNQDIIFKIATSFGFIATGIVAIFIFFQNKKAIFENNKRDSLARLSQVYADWNSNIIRNPDIRKIKTDLVWSQYGFDDDQVKKIHLLYNVLAILFMEWNICNDHKMRSGEKELREVFWELVGRINEKDRQFFLANENNLFGGYPKRFKELTDSFLKNPDAEKKRTEMMR